MPVLVNPDFRNLPGDLRSLFAAASERSFFSDPGWYDVLARHALPSGAVPRLYVAATDTNGRPAAVLPCQSAATGKGELLSLANFYSCEHGLIAAPDVDIAQAATALSQLMAGETPLWAVVRLTGFDPADRGFAALADALRCRGMSVQRFFDSGTWYEETTGWSFADYLERLPPALRNTWRRKSARLDRAGPVRWAFYDSAAEIEPGIAAYQAVYRASWKGSEPFPEFMPGLIRFAAVRGALRLGTLHLGDQPVAAQFWLLWRGRACIYKLAHDLAFDEFSPGTLLTMRMMERVLDGDHPSEINFGRGDDPYKRQWLRQRRERWGLEAANLRTPRGWPFALRHAAARLARPLRGVPSAPA